MTRLLRPTGFLQHKPWIAKEATSDDTDYKPDIQPGPGVSKAVPEPVERASSSKS